MIFLQLFWTFFKIGAFTFGGGYAMLPLVQEAVLSHGWMQEQAIVDFIAVSESTPGPLAVNMATFVGTRMGGICGAVCATLGVILPSFVIILLIARCLERFRSSTLVAEAMSGLRPAVVGLVATAVLSVGQTVMASCALWSPAFWVSLGIFLLCLLLAFRKVHPILLILLSGGLGILAGHMGLF